MLPAAEVATSSSSNWAEGSGKSGSGGRSGGAIRAPAPYSPATTGQYGAATPAKVDGRSTMSPQALPMIPAPSSEPLRASRRRPVGDVLELAPVGVAEQDREDRDLLLPPGSRP